MHDDSSSRTSFNRIKKAGSLESSQTLSESPSQEYPRVGVVCSESGVVGAAVGHTAEDGDVERGEGEWRE